jgi:hypothetical protein
MTGTISETTARKLSLRAILGILIGFAFLGASQYVRDPVNAYFLLVARSVLYVVTAYLLGMLMLEDISSRDQPPRIDVLSALFAPASILHEVAHAIVARSYGGSVEFARREDGRLGVDVDFQDPTRVGQFLTALAPTLFGLMAFAAARGWIVAAIVDPAVSPAHSIARVIVAAYLLWFTWPSAADISAAIAALTRPTFEVP